MLIFLAGVGLWGLTAVRAFAQSSQAVAAPENVYGVQMHLHGSMSEGPGSMRGHNTMARQLGGVVDVLWWTDHDWRIAAHTYVTGFDFEDGLMVRSPVPKPGEDGEEQSTAGWSRVETSLPLPRFDTSFSEEQARAGSRSWKITAAAGAGDWQRIEYRFISDRKRHIASLASDVRLRLAVYPAAMDANARLVLRALLSQQPPEVRGRIDYVLSVGPGAGGEAGVPQTQPSSDPEDGFPLRVVPVRAPLEVGRWNDLVLEVSKDAERLRLGGWDNSLAELSVALEARDGASVTLYLDAFAIERQVVGQALFDREKELVSELHTGLVQHVGQEISYDAHLNAYGLNVPLTDFATWPHGLSAEQAVKFVHEHGGIVSLNHIFGPGGQEGLRDHTTGSNRERFERIKRGTREARAYGANLFEVGYRERFYNLAAYVELWDELSADGVYITGTGVSDSHSNIKGWQTGPNNFITWAYAPSPSQEDLIAGLLAGRAFFGDPTRFDGRLDLVTPEGGRMGQVVVTKQATQRVTYRASGLRPGQTIRIVRDGQPTGEHRLTADSFEHSQEIPTDQATFVRFEVLESGQPVVFSNPLYFRPDEPAGGVPAARRPHR